MYKVNVMPGIEPGSPDTKVRIIPLDQKYWLEVLGWILSLIGLHYFHFRWLHPRFLSVHYTVNIVRNSQSTIQPASLVKRSSNLEHLQRNTWKILTRKAASFGLSSNYNMMCIFSSRFEHICTLCLQCIWPGPQWLNQLWGVCDGIISAGTGIFTWQTTMGI